MTIERLMFMPNKVCQCSALSKAANVNVRRLTEALYGVGIPARNIVGSNLYTSMTCQ